MVEWTPQQQTAITARGGNVLCAAAAGSGKTAVLSSRVLALVASPHDPLDVEELLVVTFTRAAAEEMRQRIGRELRRAAAGNARLAAQLWRLPRADITTIHGFCERTLRRAGLALGLDPSFTVLDQAEADLMWDAAFRQVLRERWTEAGPGHPAFWTMQERYGGRWPEQGLGALARRLDQLASGEDDPQAWLAAQHAALRDPSLPQARELLDQLLAAQQGLVRSALGLCARPGGPGAYVPVLERDLVALERARQAPREWDAGVEALRAISFGRLPSRDQDADPALVTQVQNLRDGWKKVVGNLTAGPWGRPEAEHIRETMEVAAHLDPLVDLVAAVRERYAQAKALRQSLDFNDLEHRTVELLRGTAGDAVGARYREVLVDESQDLSPVQDTLLSLLCARSSLFSVGDARQSIYGFRQAEPRRFLERAEQYTRHGRGELVELPHNFRSRASVLNGINMLFAPLFAAPGSGLPPALAGPLLPGASYRGDDPPLELHLLDGDSDDPESTALEREAAAVASLVVRWLAEALVQEGDGQRPARPSDVAVLLRALSGVEAQYAAALRDLGVPVWSPAGGGRIGSLEARTMLSWLRTLDNPRQDIPLAATLRGPFGGFSDNELAQIRLAAPEGDLWQALLAAGEQTAASRELAQRVRAWLARLETWRAAAMRGPLAELVASALEETGYVQYAAGLPGGGERVRTLQWMVDRCRQADRLAYADLGQVLEFLERSGASQTVAEAEATAGNAVRLLTVHGSKGLEFPMVVVAGLGRSRSHRDLEGDVLAHRELGLGARAVDPERRLRWATVRREAVRARLDADGRAEELRVLYVALTRARERLALVGTVPLAESAGRWLGLAGTTAELTTGSKPLDRLGPLLAAHPDVAAPLAALSGDAPAARGPGFGCRWEVHLGAPATAEGIATPEAVAATPCPEVLERLEAESSWRYPGHGVARIAAKVAVGDLARSEAADPEAEPVLAPPAPLGQPRFARGVATPTERGSAVHLALAHQDLDAPCDQDAVADCLARLVREQLLDARLASAVPLASLAAFWQTALGQRLRRTAARGGLHREVPFGLSVPASEIPGGAEAPSGEWVLVQGVIDVVALEDNGLLLVDYKTDRLARPGDLAQAVRRHSQQLVWYARAARAIWDLPVTEAWLVFLSRGRQIAVPLPSETDSRPG